MLENILGKACFIASKYVIDWMAGHTIEQIVIGSGSWLAKAWRVRRCEYLTGVRRLLHHGVTGALAAGKDRSNVFGHMPLPEESVL
jgi:hypothetical protein